MTREEQVLKMMSGIISKNAMTILANALEVTYQPSHCDIGDDELIERYFESKRIAGLKEKTINVYNSTLCALSNSSDNYFCEMTSDDLKNFLSLKRSEGVGQISLKNITTHIREFFKWLVNEEYINHNPALKLDKIRSEKIVKMAYSKSEMELLRNSCRDAKDRAIIEFLIATGCRISEVCALNVEDINFETHELKVVGKGNKERIVYTNEVCEMYLKAYLGNRTTGALFWSRITPHRHNANGMWCLIHAIGERAGVENVHPHRFRRTFATDMILRGMPIEQLQLIMGHENISTTQKYIDSTKIRQKSAYIMCAS